MYFFLKKEKKRSNRIQEGRGRMRVSICPLVVLIHAMSCGIDKMSAIVEVILKIFSNNSSDVIIFLLCIFQGFLYEF